MTAKFNFKNETQNIDPVPYRFMEKGQLFWIEREAIGQTDRLFIRGDEQDMEDDFWSMSVKGVMEAPGADSLVYPVPTRDSVSISYFRGGS